MEVKPIPEGLHTITPFPFVKGTPRLIEFLKAAFGATELMRIHHADGSIMHAEIKIGDSIMMMGEVMEGFSPMPGAFYLYTPDIDAMYRAALDAGGESLWEPANQFWGDRAACIKDPAGNIWWIATHVEDVDPEELARRVQSQSKRPQEKSC